jgi:hypothetical protein
MRNNRFIVVDALTPAKAFENFNLLVVSLWRNQDRDRLAYNLLGRIAEQAFRAGVQSGDNAIEALAQSSVVRRLDDRYQALRGTLGLLALGDIDQRIHGASQLTDVP